MPLAEIAEVARAVLRSSFGFAVAADGTGYVSSAPSGDQVDAADALRKALVEFEGVLVVEDTSRDERFAHLAWEGPGRVGSFAVARLRSHGGRDLGVLGAGSPNAGEIGPDVTGPLSALASLAAGLLAGRVITPDVRVQALLEHSSDLIVVLDVEGRLTYASPSLETITGFAPKDVLGRRAIQIVHPDEKDRIVELFERLHRAPQGPMPMRLRLARVDGSFVTVDAVTTSVVDDGVVYGVVVNIHPALAEPHGDSIGLDRERRAEAVLDSLQEGVILCASDGTILSCNSAATRILGRPAGRVVGAHHRELREMLAGPGGTVVDERRVPVDPERSPITVSLRDEEPEQDVVNGFVAADGSVRWIRFSTELLDVGSASGPHAVVVGIEDVTARRDAAAAEREQRIRDRTILDSLHEGVLMFDAGGRIVTSNSAVEQLFEAPADYLAGRRHEDMVATLERHGGGLEDEWGRPFPIDEHPVMIARRTGQAVSNVLLGIRRAARRPPEWFHVSARPLKRAAEEPPYPVVVSFSDVTEIRRAELERDELLGTLARERMFLSAVLGNVGEGIVACDAKGRVTVFNEAMRLFLRPPPDTDPLGRQPSVLGLQRTDGRPLRRDEHPLLAVLAGARVVNVELVAAPPNGARRLLLANGQQLTGASGELLGAVVAVHDVTAQRRLESELTALALHDPLTGLANRILLQDRLEVAFERGVREDTRVGLMLLDLDDFKQVNDTYGHGTGDGVLVSVANRLRAVVRPGDTVARLGGDEFVVVCPLAGGETELIRVRDRLKEALAVPVVVSGRQLRIGASIGLAVSHAGKSDPESLLREADEAMYMAKESRRHSLGPAR
jgi:diguanylate cyclase (GGDEF)-like protein/PAS domain S-box-containing protein